MTQTIQQRVKRESARVRIKRRIRELSNEVLAMQHERLEFAVKRHMNSAGHRLDFTRHAFLIELYCDDSQEIVIKKPRKVGVSEYLNVRVFGEANKGLSTIYILPVQRLRDVYVHTRIDPLIEKCYADMMHKDAEGSVMLKKFKKNVNAFFAGSNAKSEVIAITADQLIIDEEDFCDEENLKMAQGILDYSDYGYKIDVSTPTIRERGIDAKLKKSDQKKWTVKCVHCNKWQELNFFGNVLEKSGDIEGEWVAISQGDTSVNGGLTVHCIKCRKKIDRHMTGEYVRHNESGISGYHIPALCHPKKTTLKLFKGWEESRYNEYEKQLFMNHELGECYTPEGANLAKNILDNCKENYTLSCIHTDYNDRCTMGIDVGKYFHVRVSRRRDKHYELVYAKKLLVDDDASITEILGLIKRLRVRFGMIDARPEVKLSKAISEASKGVIWRCDYLTGEKPEQVFKEDKESEMIKVDRTWACDEMAEDYKLAKTKLPMEAHTLEQGEFYEQMAAPTRMAVVGTRGIPRIVWAEGTKPDHWFHASVYDKMAQLMMATINVTGNREDFQPKAGNRIFSGNSTDFGL